MNEDLTTLALYTYRCASCRHTGEVRLHGDDYDGAASMCDVCGGSVRLEWDDGVHVSLTKHDGQQQAV